MNNKKWNATKITREQELRYRAKKLSIEEFYGRMKKHGFRQTNRWTD